MTKQLSVRSTRSILCAFVLSGLALLISNSASAAVNFSGFTWRANGQFQLQLNTPLDGAIIFKGDLRDGKVVDVKVGSWNVTVRSYDTGESFLSVIAASDLEDTASVFLLSGPKDYTLLTSKPVVGRKATVSNDLAASLDGLHTMNQWDVSISLRKLASYIDTHPGKSVEDFANAVELGSADVQGVPKPIRGTNKAQVVPDNNDPIGQAASDQAANPNVDPNVSPNVSPNVDPSFPNNGGNVDPNFPNNVDPSYGNGAPNLPADPSLQGTGDPNPQNNDRAAHGLAPVWHEGDIY